MTAEIGAMPARFFADALCTPVTDGIREMSLASVALRAPAFERSKPFILTSSIRPPLPTFRAVVSASSIC